MKVLKFGGTSVGSSTRIKNLLPIIQREGECLVVLSAMSGTTNALLEISQLLYKNTREGARKKISVLEENYLNVIDELLSSDSIKQKAREMLSTHMNFIRSFTLDMFTINEEKAILAQGELLSTALFHFYLTEQSLESVLLPALNFMRIDENEEPDSVFIQENIKRELAVYPNKKLFITQGYIARNSFGEIDNLKRGGSDYTATLIGAAINAAEIQIWTDIDGMHNNDPRIVANTFPVTELSFDQAAELAYFGAKILHPTCVVPAREKKIPVRLLNTLQPDAVGTLISSKSDQHKIKAVAAKDGITAIRIRSGRMLLAYGFLRSVFEVFERYKTPIDMITTSEVAVSVTIDNTRDLEAILNELKEYGAVEIDPDLSIVSIIGNFTPEDQGYAWKIFDSLREIPIRMISYGGSFHNISILVKQEYKKATLEALNKGLFNL